MTAKAKNSINTIMEKALRTKVTQNVKDDIASVLDVNTDRMTARQAVVYAQIAKAIKGDKSAFEAVNSMQGAGSCDDRIYTVEIKMME